jgi:hypothetical protein
MNKEVRRMRAGGEERCPWEDACPFAWMGQMRGDVRSGLGDLARRLPRGFKEHAFAAQRETLLAMRALLDGLLEGLEGKKGPAPGKGKGRKIRVE